MLLTVMLKSATHSRLYGGGFQDLEMEGRWQALKPQQEKFCSQVLAVIAGLARVRLLYATHHSNRLGKGE